MRSRTEAALPAGAVTGTGDGNRLNTAEHQKNNLDRARPVSRRRPVTPPACHAASLR